MTLIEQQQDLIKELFEITFKLRVLEEKAKTLRLSQRADRNNASLVESIRSNEDAMAVIEREAEDLKYKLLDDFAISTQFLIKTVN